MMDEEYIQYLIQLGFDRETAEKIKEGRRVDALTEEEFLHFAAAWENDKVEPMKPLVEKYGWEGLVERLAASAQQNDG